jgi:hypothetical protein
MNVVKINVDSWHYKMLANRFMFLPPKDGYNISRSLCGYFWQVVFRFFTGLAVPLILLSPLVAIPTIELGLEPTTFLWLAMAAVGLVASAGGALMLAVALSLGTLALIGEALSRISNKIQKLGGDEPTRPNLAVEYIKAKKNKVCPVLEFVNEE